MQCVISEQWTGCHGQVSHIKINGEFPLAVNCDQIVLLQHVLNSKGLSLLIRAKLIELSETLRPIICG